MFIDKLQNVQSTMYFDFDIMPKVFWLCVDLLENNRKFEPSIFPYNQSHVLINDTPIAIAPISETAQIQIGATFVSINTTNFDKVTELGRHVIHIFRNHGIDFYRVGLVANYAFENNKIAFAKKAIFKEPSMSDYDFQYAQLYSKKMPNVSFLVNLWKRYFTVLDSTPDLLAEIDINTLASEKHKITENIFENFVTEAQRLTKTCFEEDHVF